jgi:hypothetical protein
LREEAEQQGISINALANKIMQNYRLYGRWTERFSIIQITRTTMSRLIKCCPENIIVEAAKKSGSLVTKDVLGAMGMDLTYPNIVNFTENYLGKSSNWFQYSKQTKGKKELIHLHHELGRNWSIFTANQIATMFESLLNKQAKTEIYNNFSIVEITM